MSKMISLRRILIIICLLTLIILCMGCGNNYDINSTDTVTSQTETESEENKIIMQGEGPSWSWDTSPIELDWYVSNPANKKVWDSENCWLDRWIKEKTGITRINTISSSKHINQDTLITMMMTGQMPDAITIEIKGSVAKYYDILQRDGYILPFDELAAKFAPDFYRILPRSMIEWYRYDDGNFYGLVSGFNSFERRDERNIVGNSYKIVARKDIMDKLGISPEDFLEKESFIEALHKVKDANLKSDSGEKLSVFVGGVINSHRGYAASCSESFGLWYEDDEGNYIPMQKNPAYMESVKFINRIYREGLLTTDDLNIHEYMLKEKIREAGIFLYMGYGYDKFGNEFKSALNEHGAYMVPVGPVHSDSGRVPSFSNSFVGGGTTMTMIPTGSDYPDRVVRLLGLLYSEEGQMAQTFGEEGLHYYIGEDEVGYKKAYLTEDFQKYINNSSEQEIKESFGLSTFKAAYDKQFCDAWTPVILEDEGDRMNYSVASSYSEYIYDSTCLTRRYIDPHENTEERQILISISNHMGNITDKMLVSNSEEEIDILYREAVEYCNEIGWDKLIEYQNSKVQELKQKFGVEFIPRPSADY